MDSLHISLFAVYISDYTVEYIYRPLTSPLLKPIVRCLGLLQDEGSGVEGEDRIMI